MIAVNISAVNIVTRQNSDPPGVDEAPDLSPSAYLVMAMIRDGFDTGYRIKQFIERAAAFFWSVSYGQIYPELRRLESVGLIRGREATASGRRRREYSLTAAGRRELDRWLAGPAEPTIWIRNEGMLRLLLCDWDQPDVVRKNLEDLRRRTAERLEGVRGLEPPRERGRRLQDLGVRLLEETLRWCDDTERSLVEAR
jgi:DNA-binding PadR family transcriptional regulator